MFRSSTIAAVVLASFAFGQSAQPKSQKPSAKGTAGPTTVTATPIADPKTDYSKEAFVVEKTTTTFRFENDGTLKKTTSAKYKVQSEAALQRLGQLVFGYSSATE